MKFKVGDKVIPKEFSFENDGIIFNSDMNKYVGKEQVITGARVFGVRNINLYKIDNNFEWVESALEFSEPQEYFYVGQTVYSPLFQNKERKAIITKIDKDLRYPISCEGEDDLWMFSLDGKYQNDNDFISLFQEPIQFPVNKPIERFEKGEIVEVSDCGSLWMISYYIGKSGNENYPYKCSSLKRGGEVTDGVNYKKIRKIK